MSWSCRLRTINIFVFVISVTNGADSNEKHSNCEWEIAALKWQKGLPQQIHLAFGNELSEMIVMWATDAYVKPSCQVIYGKFGSDECLKASSLQAIEFFSGDTQFHFRASLPDLNADSKYRYRIICESVVMSSVYTFTTVKPGTDWQPSFLVYGDMGRKFGEPTLRRLMREVRFSNITAVLHVGDFAYDMHDEYGQVGNDFMNRIQPYAASVPYMVCPGNHEIQDQDFHHYRHRFSMPNSDYPIPMDKMWYSMDIGKLHLISYSTEVYFVDDATYIDKQRKWLEGDLEEANKNRDNQPWVIAFGHRPMYCSNMNADDCTDSKSLTRDGLEQLFYKYGVDVIIQAHEHSYERLWPTFNNKVMAESYIDPRAPVHIISGAAGCNEQHGVCVDVILGPRGPWSAFRSWIPGIYGYGRLTIVNGTHLLWQQVMAVNGQILDQFTIVQHKHGPFS